MGAKEKRISLVCRLFSLFLLCWVHRRQFLFDSISRRKAREVSAPAASCNLPPHPSRRSLLGARGDHLRSCRSPLLFSSSPALLLWCGLLPAAMEITSWQVTSHCPATLWKRGHLSRRQFGRRRIEGLVDGVRRGWKPVRDGNGVTSLSSDKAGRPRQP